jgi:hypothetical protein
MDMLIKGTLKYIPVTGAVMALAALPLCAYGLWPLFAVGLVCGMGASAIGFLVAYKFTERAVNTGRVGAAFAGIVLRMLIYLGIMSVMTAAFGMWPGIGSAAGCLTAPAAIIARNMLAPKLRKLRRRASGGDDGQGDRHYVYEPHTRGADGALRYVFIRGSYMEKAYGGHVYMTHRRFRKLAATGTTSAGMTSAGTGGGVRS